VPGPIVHADGAAPLDPVGAGDVQPALTTVEPIILGVSRADAGTGFPLADHGLAASADNDGSTKIAAARATMHALPASSGAGDAAGSVVQFGGSVVANAVALGGADSVAPGADDTASVDTGWIIPAGADAPSGDMVTAAGLAGGAVESIVSGGGATSAAPSGARSEARSAKGDATGGPNDPVAGFASTAPIVVSGSKPGGLTFHISFDSSVGSAPVSFDTEVRAAFQFYANTFDNPGVTLYYNVGYGEVQTGGGANTPVTGLGESETFTGPSESYSKLRSTMSARAATGDAADKTALANDLPATNPTGGMVLNISMAQEKALGLASGSSGSFTNPDGNIGFGTSLISGGVPQPGFLGVVEHEISEVMGRSSWLDGSGDYSLIDLYRYAAPGVRQLSDTGNPSYFSLDGGKTDIFNWNNPSNAFGDPGDLGDWLSTNIYTPDAFNDDSETSVSNPVTSRDITLMDVLGWDRASSTTYTVGAGHSSTGIVIYSGDNEYVKSGGTAVATFAMSGGVETVSAGGKDRTAKLLSGAEQDVFGVARFVVVNGGTQVVGAGGVASGGTLSNGGGQFVDSGGVASGATIRGGGSGSFQAVYGGTATGTVVSNGGAQFVAHGGTAIGATVRSGGILEVFSAGTASRTTIERAGSGVVSSGSVANLTTINGGLFEVASGGVARGTVTFVSGGTLQLDAGANFAGVIAGFAGADRIDLRRISFAAGPTESFSEAPSNTSGTLTLTDGTHTVQLILLGFYATNDFALLNDFHGGTRVTDSPAAGGAARVTFAEIAPARLHSGAPDAGSGRLYLPSAIAASDRAYAGATLLATGPPGGPGLGSHHPPLPALR